MTSVPDRKLHMGCGESLKQSLQMISRKTDVDNERQATDSMPVNLKDSHKEKPQ